MKEAAPYWELAPVRISGVDAVGRLRDQGRDEEARDYFIAAARAVWTNRWLSARDYSLARLGEALDTDRFPVLAPVASALCRGEPDAACRFVDYVRNRRVPDMSRHICKPEPPTIALDSGPGWVWSFAAWNAWVYSKDPKWQSRLQQKIAEFLDPVNVISWHETNYPWVRLVFSSIHHGGLDDVTICRLILFGLYYAEHFNVTAHLSEPAQPSIGGNHVLYQILGWLTMVTAFPEFKRSPILAQAAITRLDDELSKQVTPDGSMIEGAPGYQSCCLNLVTNLLRICLEHKVTLPDRAHDAVRRMTLFNIGLLKPDGRTPMFGDSQDDVFADLVRGLEEFVDLPELKWALSGGRVGHVPSFTSVSSPCIGYYAMRNGWSRDAVCMVFDGGRFGQAHHHEDKLNFELQAYGREFIVDPGIHSYSDHWMREWLVVSQAHNVILVDGAGQCRWHQDRKDWYSHVPLDNPWESGPEWDQVEAAFDGPYERDIGQVRQIRRILFHKIAPVFFLVTDRMEGEGQHEITELFHLAHDIEAIERDDAGIRTRITGGPNLAIQALQPLTVETFRGVMDPPRGWVSPVRGACEKGWEIHFSGSAGLPVRRDFLLFPWRGEWPGDVRAKLLSGMGREVVELQVGSQVWKLELPV